MAMKESLMGSPVGQCGILSDVDLCAVSEMGSCERILSRGLT